MTARPTSKIESSDLKDKLVDAAAVLRALGHPIRLDIIISLESYEMNVGTLEKILELPQPVLSKHLKILHDAHIIKLRRDGRSHYYAIKDPKYTTAVTSLIADRL